MKYRVGDIVKIIEDKEVFYHGAVGRIDSYYEGDYYVVFEYIDMETGEVGIYEDCYYDESQIRLYEGEC